MVEIFVFMSLMSSLLCYMNIDPMKSCLFLVLSLILISPLISLGLQIWFSYFVCLIFLSGIFVILVYFSSLSKYNFYFFNLSYMIFVGAILTPMIYLYNSENILFSIYYLNYIWVLIWIVTCLIFFMNFTSYFLNFSGALRKF